MRLYFFLVTLSLLFIVSCGTTNDSSISNTDKATKTSEESKPSKIVFLYFSIENRKDSKEKISLNKTQVVNGRLKENTVINAPQKEGNLIVQLLSNKEQIIEEQIIENPLHQNMEVHIEEDSITQRAITVESSNFFIRFNRRETIKSVSVFKIQSSKKIKLFSKPIVL